jgi:hypothetical protein
MKRDSRSTLLLAAAAALVALADCGSSSPSQPGPSPSATATPTPTPTPTPSQPAACLLSAPTVDCGTRKRQPLEMAELLQAALDIATGTPGVMYTEYESRIYNLDLFRSRVIDHLTAAGVCGAWDYGNEIGDEIYLRSADGCVTEQYDVITGDGGVRAANKKSNTFQEGWEVPVPPPKPQWSREGDLTCSLPGERTTFCFGIKGTQGAFGPAVYTLLVAVMHENPQLFDPNDYLPAQGEFIPEQLRVAAWRILDQDAYIAVVEKKIRGAGFCGYVEKGDILKVKSVAKGNIFHEEMDIVQNPPSGTSYAGYVVKDRCHNAGF